MVCLNTIMICFTILFYICIVMIKRTLCTESRASLFTHLVTDHLVTLELSCAPRINFISD